MRNVVSWMALSYILDLSSPFVRKATNYQFGNIKTIIGISVPFTRPQVSRNSSVPSSISLWNSLDTRKIKREVNTLNSLNITSKNWGHIVLVLSEIEDSILFNAFKTFITTTEEGWFYNPNT